MKMKVIDALKTGSRIRQMCREKGLTVGDIQRALLLESTQSVYKWFSEKSTNIPSLDHLVMLGQLLDCHIDDMLVLREIDVVVSDSGELMQDLGAAKRDGD